MWRHVIGITVNQLTAVRLNCQTTGLECLKLCMQYLISNFDGRFRWPKRGSARCPGYVQAMVNVSREAGQLACARPVRDQRFGTQFLSVIVKIRSSSSSQLTVEGL
jgi:hypothetical protein